MDILAEAQFKPLTANTIRSCVLISVGKGSLPACYTFLGQGMKNERTMRKK